MKHHIIPEHSGLQCLTHTAKISLDKLLYLTAASFCEKILDDLRIQLRRIHCCQPVLSLRVYITLQGIFCKHMQSRHHKTICKIMIHTLITLGKQTQSLHRFSYSHIPVHLLFPFAGPFHILHAIICQLRKLEQFPLYQNSVAVYIPAKKQILGIAEKIMKHFILFPKKTCHLVLIFLL